MIEPIVEILMPTYNQESYIAKAIESVLMQETEFDFRLIIGEDCSTDGTESICREYSHQYSDKIKLISNDKNVGLLKNYKKLFELSSCKYLAILEGDDYWIDNRKLQKQVDLLERQPKVGLVHTDCNLLFESGKIQTGCHNKSKVKKIEYGNVFNQLILDNYIRPATVMFRKKLFDKYVSIDTYEKLDFKTLDYPMWLDISKHCKFRYLHYSSAVYRIHNQSISQSDEYEKNIIFFESTKAIKDYAVQKYNCDQDLVEKFRHQDLMKLITLNMHNKKYNKVYYLRSKLEIKGAKSFFLKILTLNRFFIDLYHLMNDTRKYFKRENFIFVV